MLDLISTLKKKEAQARNEWSNIFPKFSQVRKKPKLTDVFDHTLNTLRSVQLESGGNDYARAFRNTE